MFLILHISFLHLLLSCFCHAIQDFSDVTWAHAVNSKSLLRNALQGDLDFLEADVSLGSKGNVSGIPIMSHPPVETSDISLEEWLDNVIAAKSQKGIKLDFKSTEVLEPALAILNQKMSQITVPVWLNADIFAISGNLISKPVDAETFLTLCGTKFPKATVSLGWSTQTGLVGQSYTWEDVSRMARIIRCHNITQPITFAIRGVLVKDSLAQLLWLVRVTSKSTITVWSNKADVLLVFDLLNLRRSLPVSRVYYDLPPNQASDFKKLKNSIQSPPEDNDNGRSNVTSLPGASFDCQTETLIGGNTIVYGGKGPIAVIQTPVSDSFHFYNELRPYTFSNNTTADVKIRIKIVSSSTFLKSNSWAEQGQEVLLFGSARDIPMMQCHVTFNGSIDIKDSKTHFRMNNFGCLYGTLHTGPINISENLVVGLIIEGNRRAVISPFSLGNVQRGGANTMLLNNFYNKFYLLIMTCLHVLYRFISFR